MAKRKTTRKKSPLMIVDSMHFINDNLEFVRNEAPNLALVAATLLPFRGSFYRIGICEVNGETKLMYDICTPGMDYMQVEQHAIVDAHKVTLRMVDGEDGESFKGGRVMSLPDFWQYMRQLPQMLHVYGEPIDDDVCPVCLGEDGECDDHAKGGE